jgi:hypothetical protein
MSWVTRGAAMAAVTAGGVAVGRVLAGRERAHWPSARPSEDGRGDGWHLVTINRSPEDLAPGGRVPEPIAQLGDGVEVRLRRAPGDKGTELAVRLCQSEPSAVTDLTVRVTGDDPREAVRTALRRTKELAETGEVLSPDLTSSTKHTLPTRPVANTVRRAGEESVS